MKKELKEPYNDYIVDSLTFTVSKNANETDKKILNNHLVLNKFKKFELRNIEEQINNIYSEYIKEQSFKPREMHILIKGDLSKENSLILESAFNLNRFYLTPVNYSYLTKPGSLLFKGNFLTYN